MITALAELLRRYASGFEVLRLFDYVTFRAIVAALFAFLVTVVFGRRVIVWLFRNRFRDVSEDVLMVDASSKRGTPTMGRSVVGRHHLGVAPLW